MVLGSIALTNYCISRSRREDGRRLEEGRRREGRGREGGGREGGAQLVRLPLEEVVVEGRVEEGLELVQIVVEEGEGGGREGEGQLEQLPQPEAVGEGGGENNLVPRAARKFRVRSSPPYQQTFPTPSNYDPERDNLPIKPRRIINVVPINPKSEPVVPSDPKSKPLTPEDRDNRDKRRDIKVNPLSILPTEPPVTLANTVMLSPSKNGQPDVVRAVVTREDYGTTFFSPTIVSNVIGIGKVPGEQCLRQSAAAGRYQEANDSGSERRTFDNDANSIISSSSSSEEPFSLDDPSFQTPINDISTVPTYSPHKTTTVSSSEEPFSLDDHSLQTPINDISTVPACSPHKTTIVNLGKAVINQNGSSSSSPLTNNKEEEDDIEAGPPASPKQPEQMNKLKKKTRS